MPFCNLASQKPSRSRKEAALPTWLVGEVAQKNDLVMPFIVGSHLLLGVVAGQSKHACHRLHVDSSGREELGQQLFHQQSDLEQLRLWRSPYGKLHMLVAVYMFDQAKAIGALRVEAFLGPARSQKLFVDSREQALAFVLECLRGKGLVRSDGQIRVCMHLQTQSQIRPSQAETLV